MRALSPLSPPCEERDRVLYQGIHFHSAVVHCPLAKTIEKTHVVPYLIGLEPTDVQRGPLAQFQGKRANETETWELIRTINRTLENPLQDDQMKRVFEKWWPDLDEKLKQLPELEQNQESKRTSYNMIEEILELVRQLSQESKRECKPESRAKEIILILVNLESKSANSFIIQEQKRALDYYEMIEQLRKEKKEE